MILADTSIWIDHLRTRDPVLEQLVGQVEVAMHPFVLGELALGSLHRREAKIREWRKLPELAAQSHNHVMMLIEHRKLFSRGVGYTDANLLASSLATPGTLLWTRDRKLNAVAIELGVAARLDH